MNEPAKAVFFRHPFVRFGYSIGRGRAVRMALPRERVRSGRDRADNCVTRPRNRTESVLQIKLGLSAIHIAIQPERLHAKIMNLIVNDIVWWKISLESVVNAWIPGVFTFFLGMWLSKLDDHRKLKQKLKDDLLAIFIPIFNSGQSISITEAENAGKRMRDTFNAYRRIYPNTFRKETEEKLNGILAEGFIVGNCVNKAFMEPHKLQDLIRTL